MHAINGKIERIIVKEYNELRFIVKEDKQHSAEWNNERYVGLLEDFNVGWNVKEKLRLVAIEKDKRPTKCTRIERG